MCTPKDQNNQSQIKMSDVSILLLFTIEHHASMQVPGIVPLPGSEAGGLCHST